MKKRISIVFLLLVGVYILKAQELANGSFEKWDSKTQMPQNWGSLFKDKADIFAQSKDSKSGKASLQIKFAPQKVNDNRRFHSDRIILPPGKYTSTFFLKGEGDIRYVTLTKYKEKTGSKTTEVNRVGTPAVGSVNTDSWKKYTLTFDVLEETDYQFIFCFNAAGGEKAPSLLVDEITLKKE